MCGIAGVHSFRQTLSPAFMKEVAGRMVGALRHRGPDGEGLQEAGDGGSARVIFGHTRLAILDLSPAGGQPMCDPSTGNWLTYNGEVYNFSELRAELTAKANPSRVIDQMWRSQSDTEVVLRAYKQWGIDSLQKLRGMFAFALWDARQRVLLLARDRLGVKPLYYYSGDGFFLFASEVRALLASGLVPHRLNPEALWFYLAYQTAPVPLTLVNGVRTLLPGSFLTVDPSGRIQETRYWDLLDNASPEARYASRLQSQQRVRELLIEAVNLHLVSDVPVGVFLSGGMDSSAVVSLLRKAGVVPRTFCVGFAEKTYDETLYARRVAEHFKTDHTDILVKEREILEELPDALAAMDHPSGDGINSYVIGRAVRGTGIKVALSGLGGDELFLGYPSASRLTWAMPFLRASSHAPVALRGLAARAVNLFGGSSVRAQKTAAILETEGTLEAVFPVMRQVFSKPQRRSLFTEQWVDACERFHDPYTQLLSLAYGRHPSAGDLSKISYGEGRTYMHDVLLRDTDQMCMAHALEVRVPLLDHRLAEYVMGLPDGYKRANGSPKRLLVESLGDDFPRDALRPKMGFVLPFDPWMRGELRDFCENRLGPERLGGRGIFQSYQLMKYWRDFLSGHSNVTWSRLWTLVVLEEWLDRNNLN